MRALVIKEGSRLVVEDRPVPEPGDHDVLVRVAGAGINRADLLQRAGRYPAPPGAPPDIPGLEFAGVVEAVGAAVNSPAPGERVMGIVAGGGQAEYLVTAADHCARVPESLDLVEAGGIPEAFITAHDAMVVRGTVLRSRPAAEKAEATHLFEGQVVHLLGRGTLKAVIDAVVSLAEAERAYELVAADGTCGKVVLDLR